MNSMGVRGEPSLNRRMSLADLTMQRHARRESQASFKPPSAGQISKAVADQERFTDRRSSSQESPRGPSALAPSRQKSCPAPFLRRLSTIDLQDARDPQEVSWAERRRVRMIQRH
ncbi:unnamed protein product [Nesidiocoris tenuis]|uniref:Uncharacterized protein n=1 Tax=Nesidiocoris tenuis TaxID=355587 RepID=A0A6H5HJB8_9HEMI|nr:unnamed protein product [Nesidiocoris tenuis]